MPRFYFDVRDNGGFHRDEFGDDFVDVDEARAQCQSLLPDMARAELPDGDRHNISCEIRDETGEVVYRGELNFRGTRF
jgi:hypothetical protein